MSLYVLEQEKYKTLNNGGRKMTEENIFSKGCVIILTTRFWGARVSYMYNREE